MITANLCARSQQTLAPTAPAQPQFCPNLPPRRQPYTQVYGYLLDRDQLYDYAVKHQLDALDSRNNAEHNALRRILQQCGLDPRRTVTAKVGHGYGSCNIVALAGNLSKESMVLPPEHKIQKLKELFEVEEPPQWYLRK
jgi:hypothetical protein